MSLIKQKDIIGEVYKTNTIVGDIRTSPLSLSISNSGLEVVVSYITSTTGRVQLRNISNDDITLSYYRTSVYNGASEGSYSDSTTISSGISVTVDDTIYINSNDRINVLIAINSIRYEGFVWCSKGGQEVFITTKRLN